MAITSPREIAFAAQSLLPGGQIFEKSLLRNPAPGPFPFWSKVKMPGENVADLSVATGKNDTKMGSHACGLYGAELSCNEYQLSEDESLQSY